MHDLRRTVCVWGVWGCIEGGVLRSSSFPSCAEDTHKDRALCASLFSPWGCLEGASQKSVRGEKKENEVICSRIDRQVRAIDQRVERDGMMGGVGGGQRTGG